MRKHLSQSTLFLLLVLLVGLAACKDKNKEKVETTSYIEQNAQAFAKEVDLSRIPKIKLSAKAEEASSDWVEFLNVKLEIEKIENYSLQNLVNNSENLLESVIQLRDSLIPDEFSVIPIESRINVLVTKAEVLHQNTQRYQIDTLEIQEGGKDLYQAFGNLKIQLNEVFLEGLPEFDLDMDRKQDSIRAAKLKEDEA